MRRRLVFLGLCAGVAAGQDYDRLLEDARKLLADESRPMADRLDAEFQQLARIAIAHPDRWEAYFERGENRCKRAFYFRSEVDATLSRARAGGLSEEAVRKAQADATARIDAWRNEAYREFSLAEAQMQRLNEVDPDRLLFANAAMKFAGQEYLEARHGQRGAIEDFKELVRRNFLSLECSDHIGLCYLDIGHGLFADQRFDDAQKAWDEGLKWARSPALRKMLLTNKAGGYEADHQYLLAEKVLHDEIEADPVDPVNHKNLGLMLGYQNRLKEALYHYAKARELCGGPGTEKALLNGNAWLRAAVIHGTLLEQDGDLRLAWRLFSEYRGSFGDDYNFSLWFGDFAAALGQYDLAWRYLEHARDLQPRCPPPYQKLTQIAPRTSGTREEVEVRTKAATQALYDAKARYETDTDSAAVLKICGGVADLGDLGVGAEPAGRLDPDPLAGLDADHPPDWLLRAAPQREPFVPFDPSASPPPATSAPTPAPASERPWRLAWVGAALLAGLGALLVLGRRG